MILLALPLQLGVVATGVGAHGREQQLVLDRHVGGQGGGDGAKGLVLAGVAALGGLVGSERLRETSWSIGVFGDDGGSGAAGDEVRAGWDATGSPTRCSARAHRTW
jgi:hypothetical protein